MGDIHSAKSSSNMPFDVTGTLYRKFDTETKTNSFQTREFVIEVKEGNYPEYVKFQLTQDRCTLIDQYQTGDTIKVHFDLRGREWQGKFFTNLNAWRIERGEGERTSAADNFAPAKDTFPGVSDIPPAVDNGNDDLPF